MKTFLLLAVFISASFFSCSGGAPKAAEKIAPVDTINVADKTESSFTIVSQADSAIQNGESIQRYKNGKIKIQGMMKDGKREGLWKSFYEDGTPWSETTFHEGIKSGKTTTWYTNGNKRYEGSYASDTESGKWTYWDEQGKLVSSKDYDPDK